jgi:hypothetical protein
MASRFATSFLAPNSSALLGERLLESACHTPDYENVNVNHYRIIALERRG